MKNPDLQVSSGDVERAKEYIRQILCSSSDHYRKMREERHQLALWEETKDFSILGIIEAYTTDIRGYAAQAVSDIVLEHPQDAVRELCKLKLSNVEYFSDWYFDFHNEYPEIKHYIEMLDYLRLLVLEYINQYQLNLQTVA